MRMVVLCSGQAGQDASMLDELLGAADAGAVCGAASRVLGRDVAQWWRGLERQELFTNAHAQFAIALYQVANWQRLIGQVPAPSHVAGYSLGELIAWHVAGALDVEQTLHLVTLRAQLMDTAAPSAGGRGCLLLWRGRLSPSVRRERDAALKRLGLDIAIYRPDEERVIGGPAAALDELVAIPNLVTSQCVRLPVSVPAHTKYLREAVAPFAEHLHRVGMGEPRCPVMAGIDGRLLTSGKQAVDALSRQLAEPLRWDWCEEELAVLASDVYLELGPGNDLSRLIQGDRPEARCRSVAEFAKLDAAVEWILADR